MDITKKIRLTDLTERFVNIVVEDTIQNNGKDIVINTEASCYGNSNNGRERLQENMPEWVVNACFAAWGDTPTITDPPERPKQPNEE